MYKCINMSQNIFFSHLFRQDMYCHDSTVSVGVAQWYRLPPKEQIITGSNLARVEVLIKYFLKQICGQSLYLSFSTYKQFILSHFRYTQQLCYVSLKPYTLAGFEPGSSCSWCDVHCATPFFLSTLCTAIMLIYLHIFACLSEKNVKKVF
jgi:hypothetical protein